MNYLFAYQGFSIRYKYQLVFLVDKKESAYAGCLMRWKIACRVIGIMFYKPYR